MVNNSLYTCPRQYSYAASPDTVLIARYELHGTRLIFDEKYLRHVEP